MLSFLDNIVTLTLLQINGAHRNIKMPKLFSINASSVKKASFCHLAGNLALSLISRAGRAQTKPSRTKLPSESDGGSKIEPCGHGITPDMHIPLTKCSRTTDDPR